MSRGLLELSLINFECAAAGICTALVRPQIAAGSPRLVACIAFNPLSHTLRPQSKAKEYNAHEEQLKREAEERSNARRKCEQHRCIAKQLRRL